MGRFAERNASETKKGEFLFVELPKNPSAVLPINRKTVCLAFGFPSIDYRFLGVFNLVSMIELVMADIPISEKLFHVFPKPFFTGKRKYTCHAYPGAVTWIIVNVETTVLAEPLPVDQ